MLEEDEAVGQALPVVCATHPHHKTKIKEVKDFDTYVRDGGCSLQCTARMPCGHTCSRFSTRNYHTSILCDLVKPEAMLVSLITTPADAW